MAAVYYAASARAVCFGINDATNAFAFFANVAITNSDYVRNRYAKQPVKVQMSNAISAPRLSYYNTIYIPKAIWLTLCKWVCLRKY